MRLFTRGALTEPEDCGADREMTECKIRWKLDTLGSERRSVIEDKGKKVYVQCCHTLSIS